MTYRGNEKDFRPFIRIYHFFICLIFLFRVRSHGSLVFIPWIVGALTENILVSTMSQDRIEIIQATINSATCSRRYNSRFRVYLIWGGLRNLVLAAILNPSVKASNSNPGLLGNEYC